MPRRRRPSAQAVAVLDTLASEGAAELHGYEISRRTGIASGTLYPLLMRLAERGKLESRWELSVDGGRPRHLYRITPDGLDVARSRAGGRTITNRGRALENPA